MKQYWRIRSYLLLLAMVIALPLTSLLAVTIYLQAQEDIEHAQDSNLFVAKLVAADAERLIREARIHLEQIAERPLVRSVDPTHCDPFLADFFKLHSQFSNLVVLDTTGKVLCSADPRVANPSAFIGNTTWFKTMIETGRPLLGSPVVEPSTGKWVAVLLYPIKSLDGTLVGALALPMSLAEFHESLAPIALAGTSVTIIDSDGTVVAHSQDAARWVGQNMRGKEIVEIALERQTGTALAQGIDGSERVYGFHPVPSSGWHVYVGTLTDIAFARARSAQAHNTDLVVLTLTIGALFAIIVSHRVASPITALADGARAVAQGNLGTRVPLTGPLEIYQVTKELNEMLDITQQAQKGIAARQLQEAVIAELGVRALSGIDLHALMDDAARLSAQVLNVEYSKVRVIAGWERIAFARWRRLERGIAGACHSERGTGLPSRVYHAV